MAARNGSGRESPNPLDVMDPMDDRENRDRLIRQLAALTTPPDDDGTVEFNTVAVLKQVVERMRLLRERKSETETETETESESMEGDLQVTSSSPRRNFFTADIHDKVLNMMDGFIFVINERGVIINVNEKVEENTRYTQDDLMGRSIYDFLHTEDHEIFMDNYINITNKIKADPIIAPTIRTKIHCRLTMKNTPDEYQLFHILSGVVPNQEPDTITFIGFPMPKTQDFHVVPYAQQFITKLDMGYKILELNFCESFGEIYSDTINYSLIGKNFCSLIDPDDVSIFEHIFERAKNDGAATGAPLYMVLKTGEIAEFLTDFRYYPGGPDELDPDPYMLATNTVSG